MQAKLSVEDNIPIPKTRGCSLQPLRNVPPVVRDIPIQQCGKRNRYPFDLMRPGWSFFVLLRSGQKPESIYAGLYAGSRRAWPRAGWVIRQKIERGQCGYRVWRIY